MKELNLNAKILREKLQPIFKKYGNEKQKYQLVAQKYASFDEGERYIKTFYAPNNYIALFCMALHKSPTLKELLYWFDGVNDLEEFLQECPDCARLFEFASNNWWGDGDDYIISVTNLTKNQVLYEASEDYNIYEDESYDW